MGLYGWPSESKFQPYLEDLSGTLNDLSEENIGIVLPDEIIQYQLSKWAGTDVPINHPLVRDNNKWREIDADWEYDQTKPDDIEQLLRLIYSIAGPALKQNLPTLEEIRERAESPDISGKLYLFQHHSQIFRFVLGDDAVAFMDSQGEVKIFDYEGNRLYADQNLEKVRDYIIGGAKFTLPIADEGQLASLLGNKLAKLVLGEDGISILDLP